MTDSPQIASEQAGMAEAQSRLEAALDRLETRMAGLAAKAKNGGDKAREAELESALREASGTLTALIKDVRNAIKDAEAQLERGEPVQPELGFGGANGQS